ncbi:MAG: hypothetical protein VCA55_02620 [Verrucomicrobiales bacterium]
MKKFITILLSTSFLTLCAYADKGKEAIEKPAKPAKTDEAKKEKKDKGEKVTVAGEVKCAHCDFKIGDSCAAVLKTEKSLYFLKGKIAKKFSKENPEAKKAEASGLARKDGKNYALRVTKIAIKE